MLTLLCLLEDLLLILARYLTLRRSFCRTIVDWGDRCGHFSMVRGIGGCVHPSRVLGKSQAALDVG
jgi:hypothetical protein